MSYQTRSLDPFNVLIFGAIFLIFLLVTSPAIGQGQKISTAQTLSLNQAIQREMKGDEAHAYNIILSVGQYLHVVIDQRGIDVAVTLYAPDGKKMAEVDSPNGTQGPEPVFAIAETSGTYRLEVRSLEKGAPAGRYEVKIEELRTAMEQDKNRIAAKRAFKEAESLREQGTATSLRNAIEKYEEALPLYRAVRGHSGEATTLHNIGLVYDILGEKQKALGYYGQALPLRRGVEDRAGEATTLTNMAGIYSLLGDTQKALDYFTQALMLRRAVGDRRGEAATLLNIGYFYDSLGERQKALDYYEQALTLAHAAGARITEVRTLINIGRVYHGLGDNQKASEYYEQSLTLARTIGDRIAEAATLNNTGLLYDSLGEKQKALDYYNQALPLSRAVGDRYSEAVTLNNIGLAYDSLGEKQKALDYYQQALPLLRAAGDRDSEGATLNNIGLVYDSFSEKQKALDYYQQALSLRRAVGNRDGEAMVLNNIGAAYNDLGETQKALDYYRQALPLLRAVGHRSVEAGAFNSLMLIYQTLGNQRFAIFYGKQAVDVYGQLRSNIQGLEKDVQKTYLKSVEQTYRNLAELLITNGRYTEALQVLNAFKDQQFFDFGQMQVKQLRPLASTYRESAFARRYEKASTSLGALSSQSAEFKRKLNTRQPNAEESKQLQQLEARLRHASDEFSAIIKQTEAEFSKTADEKDKIGEVSDFTQMKAALLQLSQETSQKAVAVYTLVGQERYHTLIVTADGITAVFKPIRGEELNAKARQLWALLQSDEYDPFPLSSELYNIIFKPIEAKLPKDTRNIMWSLDGNLRYLPMAALYDGKYYLAERFNHAVFTRVDKEKMTRSVSLSWTGVGFGASRQITVEHLKAFYPFDALPNVPQELNAVFKTNNSPGGIFNGDTLLDLKFTRQAMIEALKQQRPLVHISSHFRFAPGDDARSFLLLGDGTVFPLNEMKQHRDLFQGVELLTLSACETAAQRANSNGREIDAFAELAQRLGAGAVMATLWNVSDNSSYWLLRDFYQRKHSATKQTKVEALRQAQIALINGTEKVIAATLAKNGRRGSGNSAVVKVLQEGKPRPSISEEDVVYVEAKYARPYRRNNARPYAHPYYWSPFILFGNWR